MRKWLALALALVLCLSLVGCGKQEPEQGSIINNVGTVYADKDYGFQLDMPVIGEKIVILHTTMGDISIRFFPEAAPKAVENFVTHAANGYYDGLTFHRVMKDFMIQGGDPTGTGSGGESIWGGSFEDEFDQKLLNLRGSLSMANSGVNTNGSQFFINQVGAEKFSESYTSLDEFKELCQNNVKGIQSFKEQYDNLVKQSAKEVVEAQYGTFEEALANAFTQSPSASFTNPPSKEAWDLYQKHGGNIHLDGAWRYIGGHTVFGQVFDGMDVVDAIAGVETEKDKPNTAVIINSCEVTTYQG